MNIKKIAVIGSGTMGCGIAAQVANAGIPVSLLDLPSAEGSRNQIVENAKEKILKSRPPLLIEKNKIDLISAGNIEDNFAVQKYLSERNISIERFTREDRGIDLQGIGLGKLMYKYMADWMALNNMRLHKGGTNEYSTPLWETSFKNDSRFNLVEENGKKFIDHRGMDLSYLQKPNASKKQKNKLNQI